MEQTIFPRLLWKEIRKWLYSKEAIVITGIRRSGKTTLLRFIFQRIKSSNKIFLDLENPINQQIFQTQDYRLIKLRLQEQGLSFNKRAFVFLDEIQLVPTIPSVVKFFLDHYQVKFFLTGSASFYLKNLFSETLAGRKFIFELYPLSFEEFLTFKRAKINLASFNIADPLAWEIVQPFWREYFEFGGFPEVVLTPEVEQKEKKLEEIFTSYFQKEVVQLGGFRKRDKLRDLIIVLAENIGNLLNYQRLARDLGVSRLSIEEWIAFLEATYLISLLSPFSSKSQVAIRKAKKIYLVDWGVARKFASISHGQILENCVFRLLSQKGKLHFYRRKSGGEIDFILNRKFGFEVKRKVHPQDYWKTKKLAEQLKLEKIWLISEQYSEVEHTLPVFLLDRWLSKNMR